MLLRSVLFVPGGNEKMLAKCASLEADVIMLDLEDAVVPSRKELARNLVAELIAGADSTLRKRLWVRVNAWQSGLLEDDLSQIGPLMPTGYLLPKARSAQDVTDLDRLLDELELSDEHQRSRIIAMVTEVPEALLNIGSYHASIPRLEGMSWGAEDLAAALGANANRNSDGSWISTFEFARTQCLIASAACDVAALDTVYTNYRDTDGLREYATVAARDGFDGMLAIHPEQVAVINAAFTPSQDDVDAAREVVAAFAGSPHAGAVG
ncbi:MAG: CoA ester lyase, partial [Gammaproteobacteria bacterium]|nr:CoA ester lyase [Gammaproteobacteria bacterium]